MFDEQEINGKKWIDNSDNDGIEITLRLSEHNDLPVTKFVSSLAYKVGEMELAKKKRDKQLVVNKNT